MASSTLDQQVDEFRRLDHIILEFIRLMKKVFAICGLAGLIEMVFARQPEMDEPLARVRPWADLPRELLSSIADRLTIIDLISFRGTCKDFRSASSTASAEIELSRTPWLLFHKPNSSECLIYNEQGSKTYKRNIPDLEGATCLASYQGWLLVFKDKTIFFFSPFSLAKIPLPDFPHKQMDGHVAAFSDIPTSPHCIVSIINSLDDNHVEVNFISKGKNVWTPRKLLRRNSLSSPIVTATFDHESQTFYYMDEGKSVLTYSVKDSKSQTYIFTDPKVESRGPKHHLPYRISRNVFLNTFEKKRDQFDLEDDEHVAVCGLTSKLPAKMYSNVYLNEAVEVCPTKTRMRRAVWIQPRFFEADPNHHW